MQTPENTCSPDKGSDLDLLSNEVDTTKGLWFRGLGFKGLGYLGNYGTTVYYKVMHDF